MAAFSIWTIGHSTHSAETFLALLRAHDIGVIADVRRFPGSRRHPHFGREALQANLVAAGIAYDWLPAFGGRRTPRPDSRNTAWRNSAFRGYADYMETPEFSEAAAQLERLAAERRIAIMCAEALWWQCHRALISDYLRRAVSTCGISPAPLPPVRIGSPALRTSLMDDSPIIRRSGS